MNILFTAIFSTIPFLIAFKNISPYKFTLKEYIRMEIGIVITYFLLNLIVPKFSPMAIYFVPIIFIYKNSKKIIKSIMLDVFICIIIVTIDSFIGLLSINFLKIETSITKLNYDIICIIILISIYLLSKFIGIVINKYKEIISTYYKSKYAILLYSALIITFAVFFINIHYNPSHNPIYLTKTNALFFIFYFFALLFISLIVLSIIKKDEIFKLKQAQFENLQEYTSNLENLYMDMRKFKHDYINILSSMSGFIEENNMAELRDYFNSTIRPLNKKIENNNYKLELLKNIKVAELRSLLSSKLIKAQEHNININLEIKEEISKINLNSIDLIKTIEILINNSIEVAILSKDKFMSLVIEKNNNSIVIIVTNSYCKDIGLTNEKVKEKYVDNVLKKELGLIRLKKILANNNNMSLDTISKENEFIQILTIRN